MFGVDATIGLSSRERFQPGIRRRGISRAMVRTVAIYLDRTVRSMIILTSSDAHAAGFGRASHRDICIGEAVNGRSERPGRTHRSRRSRKRRRTKLRARLRTQLADQLRTHVAEEPRRRPAEAPGAPTPNGRPRRRPTPPMPPRRNPGKRKFVMIGVLGLLALAADRLRRLFRPGRALLCLDRRRLCPRQQHHAGRPGVGPCRGDPARRQFDRSRRRRDLQDR